jgi:hypothetical protein
MVPGLQPIDNGCPMHRLQLSGLDQIELIAAVALAHDVDSRRDL